MRALTDKHPFRALIRRRWHWLLAGLLLIVLSLAAGVVLLALSGWFITASALAGLGLLLGLDIFTPGAGIRLAAIVRTASRYTERLVTHEATFRILSDLRTQLFGQLALRPISQQRALNRGDALGRFTQDIAQLDHVFLGVAGPSTGAIALTLLGGGLIAWVIDPLLAWPLIVGTALVQPMMAIGVAWRGANASNSSVLISARLKERLVDTFDGLENVLATDQVGQRVTEIGQLSDDLIRQQTKTQHWDALGTSLSILVGGLVLMLTLAIGVGFHEQGQIDGPWLGLVALLIIGVSEAWQVIPSAWRKLSESRQAWARVKPMVSPWPTATQHSEASMATEVSPHRRPSATARGAQWVVTDLTFHYPGHPIDVLRDIHLVIAPTEKVALIGPSGCGKTTLAYLLMGELSPTKGSIDCLAPSANTDGLSKHCPTVGYLAQDPKLFSDTLANNLRIAVPSASNEALISVLQKAGLRGWYDAQELGLETWIDENASNLSGGEARRLALARLMLIDPELVILDEPNTGLDASTNDALNQTLDAWLADKTALIITHQPDRAPRFDRTIRLDD